MFSNFSNRCVHISHIFIFHAKVIFSGFLFCISQLFTAFWKFLSSIVLFFHEHFYCISALLKKIAVGSLKDNCKFDIIPHNLTNRIKPLDISINLSIKGFIWNKLNAWYANTVSKQLWNGLTAGHVKVSMKMSDLKPLHTRCIVET